MAEMEVAMTEAQRDLAATNHNLIRGYANRHGLHLDEYYDLLAIALCHAAQTFDPEKGYAFSTLAYTTMSHAVARYMKDEGRLKRTPEHGLYSYNRERFADDPYSEEEIASIEDQSHRWRPGIGRMVADEFVSTLDERQQMILSGLLNGEIEETMAKRLGVSKTAVWQQIIRIKIKWLKYDGQYAKALEMKKRYFPK